MQKIADRVVKREDQEEYGIIKSAMRSSKAAAARVSLHSKSSLSKGAMLYLKMIANPWDMERPLAPMSMYAERSPMAPTTQVMTFTYDLVPVSDRLVDAGVAHATIAMSVSGTETDVRVWPSPQTKGLPIVHTTDPLVPIIAPIYVPGVTSRQWYYKVDPDCFRPTYDANTYEFASTMSQPLVFEMGSCYGTGTMPTGWKYRPVSIVKSCALDDMTNYIWIDSYNLSSTGVTLSGNITAGAVNPTTGWHIGYEVYCNTENGLVRVAAPTTTAMTVGANATTPLNPINTSLRSSGWYCFRLTITNDAPSALGQFNSVDLTLMTNENVVVTTGFYVNPSFAIAGSVAASYVPVGSTLLVSARFPHLTCEGSILGYRIPQLANSNWYRSTSAVDTLMDLNAENQANQGCGYPLTKGIYSVCVPGNFPTSSIPINSTTDSDPLGIIPPSPRSCLVGAKNPFGSFNVLVFSYSGSPESVVMRFTTHNASSLLLRNQLVGASTPVILSSEQMSEVAVCCTQMPVFTENPLHDFILAGANLIKKWANNVQKITEKVPTTVQFFEDLTWT